MGRLVFISALLSLQHLGCQSQECPKFKKNIQWMNGDKGFEGSSYRNSSRNCQLWCQEYSKWDDLGYRSVNPCIGWSFWAEPGPWSSSTWCYLFSNGSEPLQNTAHPSPGAVSGLTYDCESGRGATIGEMLFEGIDTLKLNKTTWKYILADDTDIDQDGEISEKELEHKFESYMTELFKMMDQNKDNIVTEQELRSLRFDLPLLNKVLEAALENYPIKPLFFGADVNRNGVWDESDFYLPATPFVGPLDGNGSLGLSDQEEGFSDKKNVAVTLTGGNGHNKGKVSINYEGVCQVGQNEGNVICKSLGFEGLERVTGEYEFASDPLQRLQRYICNGTEARLEDCKRTKCDRYKSFGMGVGCTKKLGKLRLVGGKDSSSGDIFLGDEGLGCAPYWSDDWHLKQSEVICRELGFPGFIKTSWESAFTKWVNPKPEALQKWFLCQGDEKRLTDCRSEAVRDDYCSGYSIQGIICKTDAGNEIVENTFLEEIVGWQLNSLEWEEIGRFLFIADANNDGKLSFEEIKVKAKDYLTTIFRFVDQTGDGYISMKDFTSLHMTTDQIHQIMDRIFDDIIGRDGQIDLLQPMVLGRNIQQYIGLGSMKEFDLNNDSKLNAVDFYSYSHRIRDKSLYLIPLLSYKLDQNQDGKINRLELRQFPDAIFKKLDIDGDGVLTFEDFYSLLRDNGYNCLQVAEWRSFIPRFTDAIENPFSALMSYLFKELDLDGNAKIALKELQQMHVPCALSRKEVKIDPWRVRCYRLFDRFFQKEFPRFPSSGGPGEDPLAIAACKMLT